MAVAAVLVAALAAPADPGLDDALGATGATALREELAARARRWAAAVAPGNAFEATSFGAAGAALHTHEGPVLLAAADVPGLDAAVASDALADLDAGVDVTLGAAHDGRPYLLGLREAALVEVVEATARDELLGELTARGLALGLLRSERRLVSAADARALALDPVAPAELRALAVRPRRG